jgi:hypothetical protein
MVLCVLASTRAAEACPRENFPWVRLENKDDSRSASTEIARLLRAELASRHIDLCDAPQPNAPAPIATVTTNVGETSATVRVGVHDSVTEKSLSRDVDLEHVPSDTRALTVALAADELLRASWAELAIASHVSSHPPPAEVVATVRDAIPTSTSRSSRVALGVAAAIDAYGTGTVFLGADVFAAFWIVPRFRIEARLGVRSALTTTSADGDVASNALVGKLGALVTITSPRRAFGADVAARIGFVRASFVPTPVAGAMGTPLTDVAVVGEVTLDGWLRLSSSLRLFLSVGPTVALRPVNITDGTRVIGGIDGGGVVSTLGIAGIF